MTAHPDERLATQRLEILPVTGIGEVTPATDLAGAIAAAAPWLRDGDVLVVTSKVVSKSEGRLVEVPRHGPERDAAREAVITAETARRVATRGQTRIVATRHGFVLASAGVDASNVDPSYLVLLPEDPDASARALRRGLRERLGVDVAVIVSDTMGRPWRKGLTDVALGVAGMDPLRDHRGEVDPYGNQLHVTQVAVVDELAGAAELVKGKCTRVPVAVVRGFDGLDAEFAQGDGPGGAALVREPALDLFSLGTAEARAAGLAEAAELGDAPTLDPIARPPVARIVARTRLAATTRASVGDGPSITLAATDPSDATQLIALGTDLHRLRAALAAAGLGTVWRPDTLTLLVGRQHHR